MVFFVEDYSVLNNIMSIVKLNRVVFFRSILDDSLEEEIDIEMPATKVCT